MRLLVPILILILSPSLGCSIMDELNKANDEMDEFVGTEEEEELAAEKAKPDPNALSKQWWESAKSLDTKELSPSIVSCRLGGGTQFMGRDECLSRGGNPKRASG